MPQLLQGGTATTTSSVAPGLAGGLPGAVMAAPEVPAGFDVPAFLREARIAFVRLQAANDRGDLADLREFTAPQMYAALAMEIQERHGAPQRNEVLSLDARLIDFEMAQGEALASVLFEGEISEDQAPAAPFREIWHVRKLIDDPRATWLLAGIQQPK
jgi:predicted lipid-binding transport protein (Tim44 family)